MLIRSLIDPKLIKGSDGQGIIGVQPGLEVIQYEQYICHLPVRKLGLSILQSFQDAV